MTGSLPSTSWLSCAGCHAACTGSTLSRGVSGTTATRGSAFTAPSAAASSRSPPLPSSRTAWPASRRDMELAATSSGPASSGPASSSVPASSSGPAASLAELQGLGRGALVGDVFEYGPERGLSGGCVQLGPVECDQGPSPVDRLGDRWRLAQLKGAQSPDGADHLVGQRGFRVRHVGQNDLPLSLRGRVVHVQEQAAPLKRL